ncbi:MAG: RpiB/LacA/LacB family sugar-phosphate isomerase [Candidatus Liptonbacteria bacterium]|nr:RpiB/LacA/LacB family sugar-phosphate isomerase [Candidatus Liptonbacteria bacterium]
MVIYLGADHRGFNLKKSIFDFLKNEGYEVVDMGDENYEENDDYVDFAEKVGAKISLEPENSRGILICGSGVGMDIAANKFKGVRCGLGISTDQIYEARYDDNVNVLSIAADFTEEESVRKIVQVFLQTQFRGGERYQRRLDKITRLEGGILK